jgi:FkbM family methyltransferase
VDPAWALHNIRMSWRRGASAGDIARQLMLRYAGALPASLRRPDWVIRMRCPQPAGDLRLALRDNGGADLFIYSEVFEHEYYALPLADPPATILDLGANIGLAAIYFARAFPDARLACVEPDPDNFRLLRRNLDMNGVDAATFAAAVHVADGTAEMLRAGAAYGHRIAGVAENGTDERFKVAAMAVPTLIDRLGWTRIGLAKIDIEGHETVLLAEPCDWLSRVDAICIEYHHDGGGRHLSAIAARHGFAPPRQLAGGLWFLARPQAHIAEHRP